MGQSTARQTGHYWEPLTGQPTVRQTERSLASLTDLPLERL